MDKKQTEALRIATESLPMLKIAASLGDETGQISFHSSHLLSLIEGYNAARQEIASLTAQPYDQQAMGLCHVCGWKGVIDYPDGPVCVACEHDKTLSPQPTAQPLHVAATSCPHEIDKDKIVLHFDSKQPGKNALAQLAARLQAAQAQEDVPDMFWDADDTENFAHEIQDIIDGYGPGEIVTIECAKRLPNLRVVVTRDGDGISYEYLEAAITAQEGCAA